MFDDFLFQIQTMDIRDWMEKFINSFDSDNSGFVYVDGEEGDYGRILFSHNGVLIATQVIEGGDSEWYEFTPEGKSLLLAMYVGLVGNQEQVSEGQKPVPQDHSSKGLPSDFTALISSVLKPGVDQFNRPRGG
jgi:hypothetical protein